jgi:hypothetical protein
MPIFRLQNDKLVIAQETDLELESHLEDWLENSPPALAQEPILWIGRQTSASIEESTIFPDLLGLDAEGNLIIVELKRDEAPREVVAQLLEYAAWANELSEQQIQEIAEDYFENGEEFKGKHFQDVFKDVFDIPDTDEVPPLNRNLRLYIVAGSIPAGVARVCRFLRTSQGMDINCINISIYQTEESDEVIVSMETKVGDENVVVTKAKRRSGEKLTDQMVWEAVQAFTNGDANVEFTLKDIERVVSEKHPDFNVERVRNWIRGGCVNFRTRRNYPICEDRYWWIERGKYRLYDPDKDKMEGGKDSNQAESVTENPA